MILDVGVDDRGERVGRMPGRVRIIVAEGMASGKLESLRDDFFRNHACPARRASPTSGVFRR
jgi:hypothetical protein